MQKSSIKKIVLILLFLVLALLFLAGGPVWRAFQKTGFQFGQQPDRLAILAGNQEGKEIYIITMDEPVRREQLTNTDGNVLDFSISPQGDRIVFSVQNLDGGADLWLTTLNNKHTDIILDCKNWLCVSAQWQPQGDVILFLEQDTASGLGTNEWKILNLKDGLVNDFFSGREIRAVDLRWSANGQWLSLWKGETAGIEVLYAATLQSAYSDMVSDDPGCFNVDENTFYYTRVHEDSIPIVSSLYQVNLVTGVIELFAGMELFESGFNFYNPVCHPLGNGMLISVQSDPKLPQRALWWLKADGSHKTVAEGLSEIITRFGWSMDGKKVFYLKDSLGSLSNGQNLVVQDLENSSTSLVLAGDVFSAIWIP